MKKLGWAGTEVLALVLFGMLLIAGAVLATRSFGSPGVAAAGVDVPLAAPSPPPPVEPLVVADLAPEEAKAKNAAVPFVSGPIAPARPFRFAGGEIERQRALACLAAAVLYEAGDDAGGQAAVAQVVLNRVRHPAFPKSVCGVVFQGSERATGCQFTFTCDGALTRAYSDAAWDRAKIVAARALGGHVDKRVGTATHYHTDWVVPYWSASLDKIAAVDTHLFFRWQGWWGTPPAFRGRYTGPERVDRRIAYLLPAEAREPEQVAAVPPDGTAVGAGETQPPVQQLGPHQVRLVEPGNNQFVVKLDPAAPSGQLAPLSLTLCRGKNPCTVLGWVKDELVPRKLPVTPANRQALSFLYHRTSAGEADQVLWNCRTFKRPDPKQCLPGTGPVEAKPEPAAAAKPAPVNLRPTRSLTGSGPGNAGQSGGGGAASLR